MFPSMCPPSCTAKPADAPFCPVHCAAMANPCAPMMGMPVMGMGMGMGMGMPMGMPMSMPCAPGMPMPLHHMGVPGFCHPSAPPAPKPKKDATEDDPPWTLDYYGMPLPLADDKASAKAYLHQVFNCPHPIVDQSIHAQIKFLVGSKCKDQVISACTRFLACGGVYSLRVLEVLQHLSAGDIIPMLEFLELLADPAKPEWHFNNGRIIILAHEHKVRAAAEKKKQDELKWSSFQAVVGKTKVPWPAPPEPLGWTLAEMYPKWDGEKKSVPPHMMQVLIPKYWMQMGGPPPPPGAGK